MFGVWYFRSMLLHWNNISNSCDFYLCQVLLHVLSVASPSSVKWKLVSCVSPLAFYYIQNIIIIDGCLPTPNWMGLIWDMYAKNTWVTCIMPEVRALMWVLFVCEHTFLSRKSNHVYFITCFQHTCQVFPSNIFPLAV